MIVKERMSLEIPLINAFMNRLTELTVQLQELAADNLLVEKTLVPSKTKMNRETRLQILVRVVPPRWLVAETQMRFSVSVDSLCSCSLNRPSLKYFLSTAQGKQISLFVWLY